LFFFFKVIPLCGKKTGSWKKWQSQKEISRGGGGGGKGEAEEGKKEERRKQSEEES
jgi:hypothetical protein